MSLFPLYQTQFLTFLQYIEPLGYGACLRPLKEKTSLKTVAQLDSVGVVSVTPTITQDVAETAAIRNFVTSEAIPADVTQVNVDIDNSICIIM